MITTQAEAAGMYQISSVQKPNWISECRMQLAPPSCVSSTPLGTPVVPEV